MDNQEELAFAFSFMSEHPKAAVRVLEQNDVGAVAALLSTAPSNYITPVLKYLLPQFAARICNNLTSERAAALLANLDANGTAIILRQMEADTRSLILHELPAGLRKHVQLLLEYPLNTVGAWMSPHMLAVANDIKNKNVLKYLKAGNRQDDCEYIYVTDRDGSFLGRTRFLDVLQASENQTVATSLDSACPSLPAQMFLAHTRDHRAWEYADVLPVTGRDNRLLGILHHHALRQGLQEMHQNRQGPAGSQDPLSSIFAVYGQSLLALLNTVSDAVDREQN